MQLDTPDSRSSVCFADTFSRKGRRSRWGGRNDRVQHTPWISLDQTVVKPQDPKFFGAKPVVALPVVKIVEMGRTVSFDDQPMLETGEVDDVATDRDLAAELQAVEAAVAQQLPEGSLIGHRLTSHRFRKASQTFSILGHLSHIANYSPAGERKAPSPIAGEGGPQGRMSSLRLAY
jgi:hypothetical protein